MAVFLYNVDITFFARSTAFSGVIDLSSAGKDIWKNGYNALDAKAKEDLAMNTFGVISYGAGAINDYVQSGSIMSGTFTKGKNGIEFTLMNTLTGTDPEQQKNVTEVLKNAEMPDAEIQNALSAAAEGGASTTSGESGKMSTDTMTPEVSQKIIEQTKPIMEDDFDLDAYLKLLQKVLYEIAEMEYEEEYIENGGEGEGELTTEEIEGTYVLTRRMVWEDYRNSSDSYDETDSITFTVKAVDETTISVTGHHDEVFEYDPSTGEVLIGEDYSAVFSKEGETIKLVYIFEYTDETGHYRAVSTGTRD